VRVAALLALLLVALLTGCEGDVVRFTVVTGGVLELAQGETQDGTVVVLDGLVSVPAGASVTGPVIVLGGTLAVGGVIDGDVTALAGRVALGEGARVAGDLRIAGDLDRHPEARVAGEVTLGAAVPAELADAIRGDPAGWLATLVRIVALGLGAGLLARFSPRAARNVAHAAGRHPLVAGSLGLLSMVVLIVLVVVMAFTVVLIPVSVLAFAVAVVTVVLGWFGLGTALGLALARRSRRSWTLARTATIGTLAFAAILAVIERIPFAWGLLPILISAVGLGAVVLTGFGVRRFVPSAVGDDTIA
jgi:cytoskeletal protein CcmA (bactofilin family)